VLGSLGKGRLKSAFENAVKAIEARRRGVPAMTTATTASITPQLRTIEGVTIQPNASERRCPGHRCHRERQRE